MLALERRQLGPGERVEAPGRPEGQVEHGDLDAGAARPAACNASAPMRATPCEVTASADAVSPNDGKGGCRNCTALGTSARVKPARAPARASVRALASPVPRGRGRYARFLCI